MGIEGTYLNIKKTKHDKPTNNITVNGEKLKAFPVRSGTTKKESPHLPLSFSTVLEVGITAIRQEKKIYIYIYKGI